jgi:alkanesulfonate monooxygenase SsuD/methylene tetrahydromethanopterin reductase-like flavin-dependent oxidoreductase (luciferase family)
MTYKIELDVNDAVDNLYPALSENQRDLLAEKIHGLWDYSAMMSEFIDVLHEVADSHAIDLEGKDGYEIETDNIYALNPPNTPFFP